MRKVLTNLQAISDITCSNQPTITKFGMPRTICNNQEHVSVREHERLLVNNQDLIAQHLDLRAAHQVLRQEYTNLRNLGNRSTAVLRESMGSDQERLNLLHRAIMLNLENMALRGLIADLRNDRDDLLEENALLRDLNFRNSNNTARGDEHMFDNDYAGEEPDEQQQN